MLAELQAPRSFVLDRLNGVEPDKRYLKAGGWVRS